MFVPSPSAPDSPHLGGIQPTWRDLPFACDLVDALYDNQGREYQQIRDDFIEASGQSKVDQMKNFLGKVAIIDADNELLPNGVFLAEVYSPASQEALIDTKQPAIKDSLAPAEQTFWRTVLFDRDWIPMLATVNIVATRDVSTQETESRAEAFRQRCKHLEKYQSFESINTWKKKTQTHFAWLEQIGLAQSGERDRFDLTDAGERLHERSQTLYHPDWPGADRR